MPTVDPTSANTAAIREQTAIPTTIRIPAQMLFAKNSWLMPRKIALKIPSMLFAAAGLGRGTQRVADRPGGDLGVGRRDQPAGAAVGEVQRADQEQQRHEVERERERRHLPGADEHVGQRGVQDRGEERAERDPDHHERVPVGLQEQRQAGADQDAVEAEQARADRAAVHAEEQRRRRRHGEAERAGEAEPRLPDEHRHQDRQPGDRVVHEADLPDAAQAGVDEVEQRVRLRAFRPRRHRPVDQTGRGCSSVCPPLVARRRRRHSMAAPRGGQGADSSAVGRRIPGC